MGRWHSLVLVALVVAGGCVSSSRDARTAPTPHGLVGRWTPTGPVEGRPGDRMRLDISEAGTVLAQWIDSSGAPAGTYTGRWEARTPTSAVFRTDSGSKGTFELLDERRMRIVGGAAPLTLRRSG